MSAKSQGDRLLAFLLGDKSLPYQYTHHAVLLVGGLGYLACSIFNYIFQTSDIILAYVQMVLFLIIIGIWYRSRFHNQYRRMALVFIFLLTLVALPVNWIYNAGLDGPTYFLNLCTLAYIRVAFRDLGIFRKLGISLIIVIPLLMMWLDLSQPGLIYSYPSEMARALDLSFSFVVTSILLLVMMGTYSRRYRLERDRAEHLADQLRILSEQDPLTGLHNRRAMDRYLDTLKERGAVFSLAILDLDHFKKLNDRFGHSYGDEVLCFYSKALNQVALNGKGLAVRLGGEEFVLLLPVTETEAVEQIQALSEKLQVSSLEHGVVTFSAGIVQYHDNESRDHLMKRADDLLYAAKNAGRNRIFSSARQSAELQEEVV